MDWVTAGTLVSACADNSLALQGEGGGEGKAERTIFQMGAGDLCADYDHP